MTTHTTTAQPKITYSAIGGTLEQIHASFEAALGKIGASFGKAHHPLIAGVITTGAGPAYESRSPIDRDIVLGSFYSPSSAQIDAAVAAARSAQKTWALTPWKDRVTVMRDVAEMIRARRYELAAILSVEIGKTRFESLGDAEEAADLIDYYASQFEANDGFVSPLGKVAPNEITEDVLRHSGVFAVIAPFNFPA